MKKITFIAVMFLAILSVSSCKKDDTTNNNGSASLIGTWNRPYNGAYATLKFNTATDFEQGFTAGGYYAQSVVGTYTATATQVTFTQVSGSGANCPGVPGTYAYTITGNTLNYTLVSDNCSGRSTTVVGTGAFTKQ